MLKNIKNSILKDYVTYKYQRYLKKLKSKNGFKFYYDSMKSFKPKYHKIIQQNVFFCL